MPSLVLGPLERQIMDVVWASDECSVRDVVRSLSSKRAYTTVMTTLDRLNQKRLLSRKMRGGHGGKFIYSARLSRQEVEESIARGHISAVLASATTSRELAISALLEAIRREDSRLFNKTIVTMTRPKRHRLD